MKIIETIGHSELVDILHSKEFLRRMDKSIEALYESGSRPVSQCAFWGVDYILGESYNHSDLHFEVPEHLLPKSTNPDFEKRLTENMYGYSKTCKQTELN